MYATLRAAGRALALDQPLMTTAPPPGANGFWVSYTGLAVAATVCLTLAAVAVNDHTAIGRMEDRLEDLKARLADGAQVAILVQHYQDLDHRVDRGEKIDEVSISDRQDLKYRVGRLEDEVKRLEDGYANEHGRAPPGGVPTLGPPGGPSPR